MNITVDLAIYPLATILRACHPFTARCHITPRSAEHDTVIVEFVPRNAQDSLQDLPGEFANALLDSHLRILIAAETQAIRELLVTQAFCEADLLDHSQSESDEYADPRRIVS